MGGVEFKQDLHRVSELPWVAMVRRELADPGLFTYRHVLTGNWMLASWAVTGKWSSFLELLTLGKSPRAITADEIAGLKLLVKGNPAGVRRARANREGLVGTENRGIKMDLEEAEQERDAWKFLRERMQPAQADHYYTRIMAGLTPLRC